MLRALLLLFSASSLCLAAFAPVIMSQTVKIVTAINKGTKGVKNSAKYDKIEKINSFSFTFLVF